MTAANISGSGASNDSIYYDGLNRQVARNVDGIKTLSVWDGWNLLAEFQNPPVDTLTRSYINGVGGEMVKELQANRYYYRDGLGSTSQLADFIGALLESYTYDGWGKPFFSLHSNTTGTDTAQSATSYGVDHLFGGQQWYPSIYLSDNRNRFYFPGIGRFLQPDPIGFAGDASNIYRNCGNNPVNRSDPSGMIPDPAPWNS